MKLKKRCPRCKAKFQQTKEGEVCDTCKAEGNALLQIAKAYARGWGLLKEEQ